MTGLRFALVGCGAIAESFYLPVLSSQRSICSELYLVDTDAERLGATADRFSATGTAPRLDAVLDRIDAAVVATPHSSHFPLARALIGAGKHVYCEKPLTASPAEAEELVRAADAAKVVLTTNNWRRSEPAFQRIAEIFRRQELGRLTAATWAEGVKFNWPTKSGFYFTQQGEDGLPPPGVLLDIGSHVVDLLCWWQGGGEPEVLECRTDSLGGPEARARLVLGFGGARAQIDLSYYQRMTNSYLLRFERGTVAGISNEGYRFQLSPDGAPPRTVDIRSGRAGGRAIAERMLSNFVAAANGASRPLFDGRDVVPSIRAIAQAYRAAKPFDAPWLPRWTHETA
ncbi:MAG: Gfo/Idh/MocA family oxidoreductase [Acetobacteraceae bacterium]|nr:Gfo/Idh/MocA family oxidoreductase [Acetobacteraceae bacterium]